LVHREAGNHPPVNFAISLLHPFNDSASEHVIRDSLSLIDTHAHGMISLELLVHQFRRVDTDEAELHSDALGLGSTAGARGSYEHYFWWLARGTVTESNAQNSCEVIHRLLLFLVFAIVEVNKLVEIGLHLPLVNVPLAVHLTRRIVDFLLSQLSVNLKDTFFNVCHRSLLVA